MAENLLFEGANLPTTPALGKAFPVQNVGMFPYKITVAASGEGLVYR